MKKICFVLALILAFVTLGGCTAILGIMDHRNKNYYKYATPGGDIEAKYSPLGSYEVEYAEFDAESDIWKKYEVFYPSEMKDSDKTYPLVIMANGTGTKASQYKEVLEHLATWGFIVVGNEDENSKTGESSAATLDFMLTQNEASDSIFCGKIDTDHIGIAGHSQGGVGALNAVTEQANGSMYKAVWAASTTSRYHADELNKSGEGWTCYPSKINVPVMMVAGTMIFDAGNMNEYTATLGEGEAQGICPLWWLEECYNAIPDGVPKIIARQTDKDHGDMLRTADGYMTAWFMYHLKDDAEAGEAFFGEDAEILNNEKWQDVNA